MVSQTQPDIPQDENTQKTEEYPDFKWTIKHIDGDSGLQFHSIPDEDSGPHLLATVCECAPEFVGLRESNGGEWFPFFLHNSYDLREIDEWWYYNVSHPELGFTDNDIRR